jgi:hypothetical protein
MYSVFRRDVTEYIIRYIRHVGGQLFPIYECKQTYKQLFPIFTNVKTYKQNFNSNMKRFFQILLRNRQYNDTRLFFLKFR